MSKGIFIPDITVEMFRNASLEAVEELLVSGEMRDIETSEDCISRSKAKIYVADLRLSELIKAEEEELLYQFIDGCSPVVADRPKGEWIPLIMNGEYKCSICGRASKSDNAAWVNIPSAYWNFCPNCGADCRGESE